jgi:hypothetical protein
MLNVYIYILCVYVYMYVYIYIYMCVCFCLFGMRGGGKQFGFVAAAAAWAEQQHGQCLFVRKLGVLLPACP